jgi:hypothetical protein
MVSYAYAVTINGEGTMMTNAGIVKEFNIIVGSDGKIRVLQTPASGIRLNALIQLSTKEKDTINFLIRMLRQNQLTNQHDLQLLGVHLYDVLFKDNNIGRALIPTCGLWYNSEKRKP